MLNNDQPLLEKTSRCISESLHIGLQKNNLRDLIFDANCTFHTPYACLLHFIFYFAAYIRLTPSGRVWPPPFEPKTDLKPNMSFMNYNQFIRNNHSLSEIVSDEEHIAFVMFLLQHSIFFVLNLSLLKRLCCYL